MSGPNFKPILTAINRVGQEVQELRKEMKPDASEPAAAGVEEIEKLVDNLGTKSYAAGRDGQDYPNEAQKQLIAAVRQLTSENRTLRNFGVTMQEQLEAAREELAKMKGTGLELLIERAGLKDELAALKAPLAWARMASLAFGLRARVKELEGAVESEQGRWQEAIYKIVSEVDPEIDGGGCDSGDPLDVSLTEINMMANAFRDELAAERQKCARLMDLLIKSKMQHGNCNGEDACTACWAAKELEDLVAAAALREKG